MLALLSERLLLGRQPALEFGNLSEAKLGRQIQVVIAFGLIGFLAK